MVKLVLQHLRRAAARATTAVHTSSSSYVSAVRQTHFVSNASPLRTNNNNSSSNASIRSFQTSAMRLKQHTTDVTKGAKQSVAKALASKKDEEEEEDEEEEDSEDDEDSDSGDEGEDSDSVDDEEDSDSDDDEDDEDEDAEPEPEEIDPENPAASYIGVTYYPSKVKKYSAELSIDGHVISGGDYWTALDAAKGYDELVDLYCDLDTPRNFPSGSSEAAEDAAAGIVVSADPSVVAEVGEWEVPEVGKRHADMIPPISKTYLTIEEVIAALEKEKAVNVYTVDLAGKSSLAEYMIFTTGRSQAHMRRMADMMIASMRARQLEDEFTYSVEGRDCDDWMIADCNNIVVHFMREDTRRILNLEDHWENMVDDKHRVYGEMTEDEYMDKFGTSELMEYLEDEDHSNPDENEPDGSGVEWK